MMIYTLAQDLFDRVQKDFSFELKTRLRIVADIHMFRAGEDESLWLQKKEEKYNYQVFFDDIFVCFVDTEMSLNEAYLAVIKGLLELKKGKKIYWNKFLYEIEEQKKEKPKKKKKVTPKGSGIEHKIITQVLNKNK